MRRLGLLTGLLVASTVLSLRAQPSQAASGNAATPSAEGAIVPDDLVVREMLKTPHGLPESEVRESLRHCDGNNTQMKVCAAYQWTVQDIRLNRVYAKALAAAQDAGTASALIKAQRSWLAYRDTECAFEGARGAGGGTLEGLYVLDCKESLTKQQADRLDGGAGQ